jgi:NADPH-dependent curcumin reductase CurA
MVFERDAISNRRLLLVRRPAGVPVEDDFTLDEARLPWPEDGEFVVRNLFLSVDPAQRGWATTGTHYAPPVPIGTVMRALAVGEVIASRNAAFPVGAHLYGWFGWQEYAVAAAGDVLTIIDASDIPLSAFAGVLGINGLTAALALDRIGRPMAGETVIVTTAAGAVGSVAAQLAKAAGCVVVGITGSDEKVARCIDRFGCHRAINYRDGPIGPLLDASLPDGADILFDSVGGDLLDAMIRRLRHGGRIIQCGTASVPAWSPPPTGLRNERELLLKSLLWGGFVIFDHVAEFGGVLRRLSALLREGKLRYEEDIRHGLIEAPRALADVYAGRNRGKALIAL